MCLGLARLVKESHKHRPFPNCRGQQVNCLGLAGLINSHSHHSACRGLVCNIKAKLAPCLQAKRQKHGGPEALHIWFTAKAGPHL